MKSGNGPDSPDDNDGNDADILRGVRRAGTARTFVPVCKEIIADLLTPVSAFLKIAEHSDYAFLLESVEGASMSLDIPSLGRIPSSCCARRTARPCSSGPA